MHPAPAAFSRTILLAAFSLLLAPLLAACAPATPSAPSKPAAEAPAAPGAPAKPAAAPASAPGEAKPAPSPAAAAAGAPKRGGVVRIGTYQEPILINPILGTQTINNIVSENIIEGLLQPTPDGNFAPNLAAEVPSTQNGGLSADSLTVTWKLKQGVTWSDGKPFTSKDVLFTYNVIMNPGNPVVNRTGYDQIASITTPDDSTVVVKYKQIYAPFKSHFPWVLPEHPFNGDSVIDKKDFNRAPIGTGPFKFTSWASGDNITYERNPNFRDKEKPYLDGLIFKITPSREAAVQALKVGEIDIIWNLIESNLPEFDGLSDVDLEPGPSPRVERLILNASCPSGPQQGDPTCPHPVLGDLKVRQAIELAIDKKAIVDKLLFGKTTVATSVIPLGWFAPKLDPSEYNANKSKQLLDEAGWKPGPDGIRLKDGVRAHIEYGTTTGDRLREQTQQVIQEMLKGVGIEVEIKNSPSAVLLGGWADNAPRAKGNFDMLMWTTNSDIDPQAHLSNYFHSNQIPTEQTRSGRNYHRVPDPELDKALETAGGTTDESARIAAYKTVAERVNAGKGHVVLYNRLDLDAFKKYVKAHVVNVWDNFTWNTEDWWLDK